MTKKLFVMALGAVAWIGMPNGASLVHAGMDWTDFCAPDQAAIAQALKDHPTDRFDRSSCSDGLYRRGTCEVKPYDPPSGTRDQEVIFEVKLKSNGGVERHYRILMGLAPSDQVRSSHDVCQVRQVRVSSRRRHGGSG